MSQLAHRIVPNDFRSFERASEGCIQTASAHVAWTAGSSGMVTAMKRRRGESTVPSATGPRRVLAEISAKAIQKRAT